MNNNKPTTVKRVGKIVLITILSIIGFFILVGIIAVATDDGERTTTADDTSSETTEQSTDLELSVRTGNFHMTVANKESGVLKNCEVQINPSLFSSGYTTRVASIGSEPVEIGYGEFTKDSKRFNIAEYAVEEIVVRDCTDQQSRKGLYEVNKQ